MDINEITDKYLFVEPGSVFICVFEYSSVLTIEGLEAATPGDAAPNPKKLAVVASTMGGSGEIISGNRRRLISAFATDVGLALRRSEEYFVGKQKEFSTIETERFADIRSDLESSEDKYSTAKRILESDVFKILMDPLAIAGGESVAIAWAFSSLLGSSQVPKLDNWAQAKAAVMDVRKTLTSFSPVATSPRRGLHAHQKLAAIQALIPEIIPGTPLAIHVLYQFVLGAMYIRSADVSKRRESLILNGEERAEDFDDDFQ